jgi:hypothetical protein
MEEVCEWENCMQALKRVKANKGSPAERVNEFETGGGII